MMKTNIFLAIAATYILGCTAKNASDRRDEDDADAGDTSSETDDTDGTDDTGAGDADADSDGDVDTDTDTSICSPGEMWCLNNKVIQCNEEGDDWIDVENCDDKDLICAAGECKDVSTECAEAMNEFSYVGCEYWAVSLANALINYSDSGNYIEDEPFRYAIAVANSGDDVANVHVTDGPGGSVDSNYQVPAGEMIVIEDLPWKEAVSNVSLGGTSWKYHYTRKVANAGYHLTTDRPVTMYQFNPLQYQSGSHFSYSNDASLLLPSHVYNREYIVLTQPTLKYIAGGEAGNYPGFFAVVGQASGPSTLKITYSSYTAKSDDKSNEEFEEFEPGHVQTITIQPYEVLQVLSGDGGTSCPGKTECNARMWSCDMSEEYDLTGTTIELVEGPKPAVFAGAVCAYAPYHTQACDHLEQQLFPTKSLGTRYLCAHQVTQRPKEPTLWRIMSAQDNNEITFFPASIHQTITLNKGEHVELESLYDFEIRGTGRIAVAQIMVGQNYTSWVNPPNYGDPAMAYAVPLTQYRKEYTFLAPDSFARSYITVIHKTGVFPSLDGTPISGDTLGVTNNYSRTNLEIFGGIHNITSEEPFGITVYGVGTYTSYMYPGGLDLKEIDVPVV